MTSDSDPEASSRRDDRGSAVPRGVSIGLIVFALASMQWLAFVGVVPAAAAHAWCLTLPAGWLFLQLLMRTGWARQRADPSMMMPRVLFAVMCLMAAYAMLGPLRARVLIGVLLVLVLGTLTMTARKAMVTAVAAAVVVGLTSAALALWSPETHSPGVEFWNFLVTALAAPLAVGIAHRIDALRRKVREQREELARAMAQIRELASRDELTGLASRRHMQELMEQELQRRIRSGQPFCLVRLGIDAPRRVDDAVVQALAQETLRQVRSADYVGRWGGDEFLIMLPDTRETLALAPMQRLVQRLAALLDEHGAGAAGVAVSGGLAEHRIGETVQLTLDRAATAVLQAKAAGGSRIHVA